MYRVFDTFHGTIPLIAYRHVFKNGDIVDIKCHGAVKPVGYTTLLHVGVIINKRVRSKILAKRINVRVEHVHHSKCRENSLHRSKENELKLEEAKAKGVYVTLKRIQEPIPLAPIPHEVVG